VALVYGALLLAFWLGFRRSDLATSLGSSFTRALASFGLLLAPLWFFGFGVAVPLKALPSWAKIACASALAGPYFVFALGTQDFQFRVAIIVIAFPALLAAFLQLPNLPPKLMWRDAVVLGIIAATYYLRLLQTAWPEPALAIFPKLFLADVALYCFLVVRRLEGAGYSLVPTGSALIVGVREWAFYLPIALALGELTSFIHFHAAQLAPAKIAAVWLLTFLLIALPEELFFRGILQNFLETRLGRTWALAVSALLFGLSHFNHGASFNWKYVMLASIAGIFYGRAWRANRQVLASVVTHTAVDVVWSVWFR
jgi:CAAX protease family protein